MFTAKRLLRLYPPSWRERYGDEFLMTVGPGSLPPQQIIDIVSGAIDAWLSADVRRTIRTRSLALSGGGPMTLKCLGICEPSATRYTRRDSLIGAGVMIGVTLILSTLGIAARREGWPIAAAILLNTSFPGSLTLSLPFWLMKGQPWRAQTAIVAATLIVLIAMSYAAVRVNL